MLPSERARSQFAGLKARKQRPAKAASLKIFDYQGGVVDPVIMPRREAPRLPNYNWIGFHDHHTDHLSDRMDRLETRLCQEVSELRLGISAIASAVRNLSVADDVDDHTIDVTVWERAALNNPPLTDVISALDMIGEHETVPENADWSTIAIEYLSSSSPAARAAAARAAPLVLTSTDAKARLIAALASEEHPYVIAAIKGSLFGLA